MNLAKGTCPALKSQLKIAWKDVLKSTKSLYINISSNAVCTVIDYIVPARSSWWNDWLKGYPMVLFIEIGIHVHVYTYRNGNFYIHIYTHTDVLLLGGKINQNMGLLWPTFYTSLSFKFYVILKAILNWCYALQNLCVYNKCLCKIRNELWFFFLHYGCYDTSKYWKFA